MLVPRDASVALASASPLATTRGSNRFLSFLASGCMVAVGYMDPGNWATSLGAGARFGYSLLGILLFANVSAMLLQSAALRLGIVRGIDLAAACRQHFSPSLNLALWVACEIAIIACNVAEVLGMALGLTLVFHLPFALSVPLTTLDILLVLLLQEAGIGYLEAFIAALVLLITASFACELYWLQPSPRVLLGALATPSVLRDREALYLAVGIIGATVMPHNLYLHSALVARRGMCSPGEVRSQLRRATYGSNAALTLAFAVNAAILILSAGAFGGATQRPSDLSHAYQLLSPTLGVHGASTVFGIALIAAGLSSSVTGTVAGQIVMEGFLSLSWPAWKRSVVTRALALLPAALALALVGEQGLQKLLVFSQIVLALQLPLAAIPLLCFTTRRRYMGTYAFRPGMGAALWGCAACILALNLYMAVQLLKS
jgi:manganese transport protein